MVKKNNPLSPFPSDFVPQPQKKKAAWIKQACKAAHSYSNLNFTSSLDSERQKYIMLRKYASGGYDKQKFKNLISGRGNTTLSNYNLNIATPIPTIVENLVGDFENQGLKPTVKCLSPQGVTQYDKKIKELKADRFLMSKADELLKAGVDIKTKLSGKVIVEDDEEIELYMDTNFKDDYTSAMQAAINFVMEANELEAWRRKVYRDLIVGGKGVIKVSFDENFDIRVRYVDIVQHISDYVKNDDFSDAKYQGEYLEMNIDELAELAQDELSEEQLMEIARTVAGKNGNGDWVQSWGTKYYPASIDEVRPYGRFKVVVLDLEYKSVDKYRYEKKKAKGGGFYFDRIHGKPKSEDSEIVEKKLVNIYKGKYIVGTEYVFDYGLKENMTREVINGNYSGDTEFSFIAFAPDIYDMRNTSIIERLIGLADAYILTNLKAQTIIAKARTQGIKIDVSMLGAITNALGEKNIKPRELIDMMDQTSTYYISSVTEKGTVLPNMNPIQEVPESPMLGLQSLAAHEQGILRAMEFATGVPLSTIGAPPSETLVGLQKAAAENRNNATRFINHAYKSILSRACKVIVMMVQDSISGKAKKIDDYRMSIGNYNANLLEFTKELTGAQFGIFIDTLPDAVEQQNMLDMVNRGLQVGSIFQSQGMRILRIGKENPELAERLMAFYEKKNAKQQQEAAQMNAQAQAQANAQAAQLAEQAKQQTLQLEFQLKAQYLQLEYQLKGQMSQLDHREDVNLELVKGDIKAEHIEIATGQENEGVKEADLRSTSFPKEAGQVEPRVFPAETQI